MNILKIKFILILCILSSALFSQRDYNNVIYGVSNGIIPKIYPVSTTFNGKIISGEYLTILASGHNKVEKPYIFVEGIDFLDNIDFDSHIRLINNSLPYGNRLIEELYNNGFDVIILDFDNSTDYIQNNAMLLVKLINDIYANNSLTEDNFGVMGYSMGGLVARYALTWMEANNQNHHTRLFVSHDAPQKGANFPLGLQELIQDIKFNTSFLWIAIDLLMIEFNASMPAASQMLIYHYSNSNNGIAKPSDLSIDFFRELYNLSPTTNGYPSVPLKIATSNGNYNGQTQKAGIGNLIKPGDKILEFIYKKNNGTYQVCNLFGYCKTYKNPDDVIDISVRAGFDDTEPLEKFYINLMLGNNVVKTWATGSGQQTFISGNIPYDIAPGSYSESYMVKMHNAISNALKVPVQGLSQTCFIPTVSALDLNIGYKDIFDPNNSQCFTNFDYIHANGSGNNDHFELANDAVSFIMNHVLSNESPRQKYYFDADNITIPDNQIINADQSYNKTAKYSITNENLFKVNSGGSSNLIAGSSIELKPGFTVETGGLFSAEIGYIDLMCDNAIIFNERQLAKGLLPVIEGTSIQTSYDCNNVTDIPDYNPDFTYFDCVTPDILSPTVIDSLLNANIMVFPNPTTGIMNIVFSDEIPINDLVICIYDYINNLIYTINPVNSHNLNFSLPNCLPGLLTVQFNFNLNGGSYIFNKKILKQ